MTTKKKLTKKEKELYKQFIAICERSAELIESGQYSWTDIANGFKEMSKHFQEKIQ